MEFLFHFSQKSSLACQVAISFDQKYTEASTDGDRQSPSDNDALGFNVEDGLVDADRSCRFVIQNAPSELE